MSGILPHAEERDLCFATYLLRSLLTGVIAFLVARSFATAPPWVLIVGVYVLSLPIMLGVLYRQTLGRISLLHRWATKGRLYRFLSNRLLMIAFAIVWSISASFVMVAQLNKATLGEWASFFIVAPIFWIVFRSSRRLLSPELKPIHLTKDAIYLAVLCCPPLALVFNLALTIPFETLPNFDTVQQAIAAEKALIPSSGDNAIILELLQWLAIYDGVSSYALGQLAKWHPTIALVPFMLGRLVLYYGATALFASLVIPNAELRRVFGPLTDAQEPPPVGTRRIALATGMLTFITLFIYIPIMANIDSHAREIHAVRRSREVMEERVVQSVQSVEKIGEALYQEGTLEQLRLAKIRVLQELDGSLARMEGNADRVFDQMEANVDAYLDWYYSLFGEYSRIGNMLVGEIESFMEKKLIEHLQSGEIYKSIEAALQQALQAHTAIRQTYELEARAILERLKLDLPVSDVRVTRAESLEKAIDLPIHQDAIKLETRLVASGAAGVVGFITTIVVAKIVAKNIVKLAAKAMLKVVGGKVLGTGGGATAGAAAGFWIGSAVPGVGTVVGAAIGGILGGIAAGVAIDKLLLMLEEEYSREEFKAQLIGAINEARSEFKATLHKSGKAFAASNDVSSTGQASSEQVNSLPGGSPPDSRADVGGRETTVLDRTVPELTLSGDVGGAFVGLAVVEPEAPDETSEVKREGGMRRRKENRRPGSKRVEIRYSGTAWNRTAGRDGDQPPQVPEGPVEYASGIEYTAQNLDLMMTTYDSPDTLFGMLRSNPGNQRLSDEKLKAAISRGRQFPVDYVEVVSKPLIVRVGDAFSLIATPSDNDSNSIASLKVKVRAPSRAANEVQFFTASPDGANGSVRIDARYMIPTPTVTKPGEPPGAAGEDPRDAISFVIEDAGGNRLEIKIPLIATEGAY